LIDLSNIERRRQHDQLLEQQRSDGPILRSRFSCACDFAFAWEKEMKERPILFSAPMVRALLDGSKTQTRRIVKPAGAHEIFPFIGSDNNPTGEFGWCPSPSYISKHIYCPYGQPGERLWVRETFGHAWHHAQPRYFYRATDDKNVGWHPDFNGWKPSIHMPREASRITLEITDVRVERLQDISEADAQAEGARECDVTGREVILAPPSQRGSYVRHYRHIWESINGAGSWDANPWVWCITFGRVP
jgi:hypothetical protein